MPSPPTRASAVVESEDAAKSSHAHATWRRLLGLDEVQLTDEARLVEKAQRGDGEALGQLLQRYERRLYAIALTKLDSRWDAQDAVQETLLEACAKLGTLRSPDSLGAWLATIVLHKCHHIRAAKRPVAAGELPHGDAFVFVGTDRDEEVLQAVATLPEEQGTAIALRFYLDLSYKEIARLTGAREGTVKSRLHRGMSHLRTVLDNRRTRSGV